MEVTMQLTDSKTQRTSFLENNTVHSNYALKVDCISQENRINTHHYRTEHVQVETVFVHDFWL